jgi:tetratricopeptide (TPR) repeat protein
MLRMTWSARMAALVCVLTGLPGSHVSAQEESGARDGRYEATIDRAMLEFDAGRFVAARGLFERAHALRPSARTLRGLGVTALALKRYNAAREELNGALVDARRPLTEAQRVQVTQLLDWMQKDLARLRLELSPSHARAFVDDQPVSAGVTWLDAGEHRLIVNAEGFRPQDRTFRLFAQQELALGIELVPDPEPLAQAPSRALSPSAPTRSPPEDEGAALTQRWWFWTGLAVVAVAGASVTLVLLNQADPEHEPGGIGGVVRTLRGGAR